MEYQDLFKALDQKNIRYLLCGGLAVNIYGIPRMTADIDILLDFTAENIGDFENAIKPLMYESRHPVKLNNFIREDDRKNAVNKNNLIAYSYFNARSNHMSLDVLLDVPLSFHLLWDGRETRDMEGVKINLVSIEHLIELKKYANRKQDIDDVVLLSKLLKK